MKYNINGKYHLIIEIDSWINSIKLFQIKKLKFKLVGQFFCAIFDKIHFMKYFETATFIKWLCI